MQKTNTIIIGAGQAGLALSRSLFDRGIEHVLLERGRVAQRWTERWESLRLLSPNWMTRLPGGGYQGDHPDGFMTRDQVIGFLSGYAASFEAPVQEQTTVLRVSPTNDGWRVLTNTGSWSAQNVVIATGYTQSTRIPGMATALPGHITQLATSAYRNPEQLPMGGVLVVGASASGAQLADEIARSGREVTLAVGRHTRVPRRYRGRDIMYWLDRLGSLRRPLSDMPNSDEARLEPSLQLFGNESGQNLDLSVLAANGIQLAGRLLRVEHGRLRFGNELTQTTAAADHQMGRLLDRIDRHISTHGFENEFPSPESWNLIPPTAAPLELSLDASGIQSVLWATGYERSYPWLDADVLDSKGEVRNQRGRTPAPGLFIIGMQFMIRRNSSFIDGVGRDAAEISEAIAHRADERAREAA